MLYYYILIFILFFIVLFFLTRQKRNREKCVKPIAPIARRRGGVVGVTGFYSVVNNTTDIIYTFSANVNTLLFSNPGGFSTPSNLTLLNITTPYITTPASISLTYGDVTGNANGVISNIISGINSEIITFQYQLTSPSSVFVSPPLLAVYGLSYDNMTSVLDLTLT